MTMGAHHHMLTISFIHHCSNNHREHTTIQVKVQLSKRNERRLDNSHQAWLKTMLEMEVTSKE